MSTVRDNLAMQADPISRSPWTSWSWWRLNFEELEIELNCTRNTKVKFKILFFFFQIFRFAAGGRALGWSLQHQSSRLPTSHSAGPPGSARSTVAGGVSCGGTNCLSQLGIAQSQARRDPRDSDTSWPYHTCLVSM